MDLLLTCALLFNVNLLPQDLCHHEMVELNSPNPQENGLFGGKVFGIPDIDEDGWGDFVIRAYQTPQFENSALHIYSGQNNTLLYTLTSSIPEPDDGIFGFLLTAMPDISGDGIADLAVTGTTGTGDTDVIYFFDGHLGSLLQAFFWPKECFTVFSGIQDQNDDGFGELLVGSADCGLSVLSGATGTILLSFSPRADLEGQYCEHLNRISSDPAMPAQDLNGDGVQEIVIAGEGCQEGKEFGDYYGCKPLIAIYDLTTGGTLLHAATSSAEAQDANGLVLGISNIPDVTGDAIDDVLVLGKNKVHLFSGSNAAVVSHFDVPNNNTGIIGNTTAIGIPDIDGDGKGDFALAHAEFVCVPTCPPDDPGVVYLCSSTTGCYPIQTLHSPSVEDSRFGIGISEIPAAGNEPLPRLLIGAYDENVNGISQVGRAYVASLRTDIDHDGVSDSCDICLGYDDAVDSDGDGIPNGCDPDHFTNIISSYPSNGDIDARQSPIAAGTSGSALVGATVFRLYFDGPVLNILPQNFAITENGGDGIPPAIAFLDVPHHGIHAVTINLAEAIEPGAWTTIRHEPSGTQLRVGSLPGDVNGDGTSSPNDILSLINRLNGVISLPVWNTDINRNLQLEPSDILRLIDLLNGAGEFDVWNGVSLPD